MRKKIIIISALLSVFFLTSCKCQHTWEDATCTMAKVCKDCGISEGNALGHVWENATCTAAKVCKECGISEGNALGHEYVDKYCTRCNEVDPNAFFIEDYGFIKNNGMCKWIEITSYDLKVGYVQFDGNSQQEHVKIEDKAIYTGISWTGEEEDYEYTPHLYTAIDNDTISANSTRWVITERVINGDMLVIKTIRGNREIWYVLEDMINTEDVEEIDDDNGWLYPARKYYFK